MWTRKICIPPPPTSFLWQQMQFGRAVNVSLITNKAVCLFVLPAQLCYYLEIYVANRSLMFKEVGDFLKQTAV